MINTIELLEMEKWFSEITIPKEVRIDAGTKHLDAPTFVKDNIELLKGKVNPVIAAQRWYMLNQLKRAILDPVK